ncbi:orf101 [Sucra jujuba nucleopolyhedrovirus]|uniref:Orf101 n=1 Tax=Sucra jujuba nucleopolyhedrovirus TaxID=1563660 RepID=A0A097P931_9ABAC|nr:orf101 [Sucra jujuba nucleopolyhedrovirus]AIU41340.1 orf101 [Sucra jujuba nucleopolyhedrovirus]
MAAVLQVIEIDFSTDFICETLKYVLHKNKAGEIEYKCLNCVNCNWSTESMTDFGLYHDLVYEHRLKNVKKCVASRVSCHQCGQEIARYESIKNCDECLNFCNAVYSKDIASGRMVINDEQNRTR